MSKVILAEKPSVARDIAAVVGANARKNGYLEGNGYKITWAIGHLVQLAMPKAYGYESWNLSQLPILPEKFKLQISPDGGIQKQFKIISGLFKQADQIIVATDAGREGELIYRYIQTLCGTSKASIQRLWISDLTEKTIRKGLENLKPISDYDNLYKAGKARSQADWLVGMNFTQAFTLSSGKSKPLSIGRVQTATLRLIVDRFIENTTFKKVPFFQGLIYMSHNGSSFFLQGETHFENKQSAEQLVQPLKGILSPPLEVGNKKINENSPFLYDLTTLQREANKLYGFTAANTLKIAQSLYERTKLITYPRTDSQYLSENQVQDVKALFENLSGQIGNFNLQDLNSTCLSNIQGNKVFNDQKISDHHAIIPTGTASDKAQLSESEHKIYMLILMRFYQAFLNPCQKHTRSIKTRINGENFSASSTRIITPGWRIFYNLEEKPMLPEIENGSKKTIEDIGVKEGETKPKALFTENTLLAIMETAGKLVEDKTLKESLKEKGLGTPATRASIIETLIKREYITRQKNKLIPTEIGLELIKALRHLSICSPELTGEIEAKLNQIEKGNYQYSKFMLEMNNYIEDLLPEIIKNAKTLNNISFKSDKANAFDFGSCPKCKSGKLKKAKSGKSLYCSNWKAEPACTFSFWNTLAGKKLSDKQTLDLLTKGKIGPIKGFTSKKGKSFEASLEITKEYKINFVFKNAKAS